MLLIFDCDGVVVDSMPLHAEIETEALRGIGIRVDANDIHIRFAGVPFRDICAILGKEAGVPIPDDFVRETSALKFEVFERRLTPVSGISDFLEGCRDAAGICVASGSPSDLLYHSLRVTGLHDSFAPHIYSSDCVTRGKPAPDLFLFAARQFGVAPAKCVVIEDGIAGVIAGVAAGMAVIGFAGGSHCDAAHAGRLREAGAVAVFDDYRSPPASLADFLSGRPAGSASFPSARPSPASQSP